MRKNPRASLALAIVLTLALFAGLTTPVFAVTSATNDIWDGTYPVSAPATSFGGGTGTKADPYLISSATYLAQLNSNVAAAINYSGKYFQLTTDIDLAGDKFSWRPIGGVGSEVQGVPDAPYFSGAFNGDNHTISNMTILMDDTEKYTSGYGLFGYINGGAVANLVVGTIGGSDNSQIVFAPSAVSDFTNVGGVVGYLYGSIYNVQSAVTVTADTTGSSGIGGVVGTIERLVQTGADPVEIGIYQSSNAKRITGGSRVGGIVGAVYVHYTTDTSGDGVTISECANLDSVEVSTVRTSGRAYIGGIAGYNEGRISHSYNQGTFASDGGNYVGGLTGILTNYNLLPPIGDIDNSYSSTATGGFPTSTTDVQSLYASADDSDNPTITNALWLLNNIGQEDWGTWDGVVQDASVAELYGDVVLAGQTQTLVELFGSFTLDGAPQSYFVAASPYAVLWWQTMTWESDAFGTILPINPQPTPDNPNAVFLDGTLPTGEGEGTQDDPYADFAAALMDLAGKDEPDQIIYIVGEVSRIPVGSTIFTQGLVPGMIQRSSTYDGYLFNPESDVTFTNITIDGNSANMNIASDSLIAVRSGVTVTLDFGTLLRNNLADSGAGVRVNGGTLNSVNTSTSTDPAPLITSNAAMGNGGGVAVYGGGSFTLTAGTISANRGSFGGGVVVGDNSDSSFTMNGGSITGNTSNDGGGLAITNGSAEVTGGTISGNTAANAGSAIFVDDHTYGLTLAPSGGTFSISGVIYLSDGEYISLSEPLADISLTVEVEFPANGVTVVQGVDAYEIDPDDLAALSYATGGWGFVLDDTNNRITLISIR